MNKASFQAWVSVHRWSGLICTLFLLVICLTGLPLIFNDEIGGWLDASAPYARVAADAPAARLDGLLAIARQRYPDQIVMSTFVDDDEPQVIVGLVPSWDRYRRDHHVLHFVKFDAHSAAVLRDDAQSGEAGRGFLSFLLNLHRDMFAGLAGDLFLGVMALFFIVAVISGVVLYGPFMKRLSFGSIRVRRSVRLSVLDMHNLLGIVLTAWMGVVGITGVMNELSTPLFTLWQRSMARTLLAPWRGAEVSATPELTSLDAVFHAAQESAPEMRVMSAIFPGSPFGTASHYLVWMKGRTPLTGRLFTPVLVDARTGKVTAVVKMPWYLRALEISRPLHFGDYGGLPLKIIWALLDLVTIVVLGSGLYLWISKRKISTDARLRALGSGLDAEKASVSTPHSVTEGR